MREYLSVPEATKVIASEVVEFGKSKDWAGDNEIAREVEKRLAKFNVGYDGKTQSWSHRMNGSRYFTAMKYMGVAKGKLGSILSALKK